MKTKLTRHRRPNPATLRTAPPTWEDALGATNGDNRSPWVVDVIPQLRVTAQRNSGLISGKTSLVSKQSWFFR